jgi:hypothetical protein
MSYLGDIGGAKAPPLRIGGNHTCQRLFKIKYLSYYMQYQRVFVIST